MRIARQLAALVFFAAMPAFAFADDPAPPQAPAPPAAVQALDNLLQAWERNCTAAKHFSCDVERWEFDRRFGPRDSNGSPIASTYCTGEIRLEKPDKALLRFDPPGFYVEPRAVGKLTTYETRRGEFGDHWIYDGKQLFEFASAYSVLWKHALPAEQRGRTPTTVSFPLLWLGEIRPFEPLFVFEVKAKELKRDFWIQIVTPPQAKNQHWLELWPKAKDPSFRYAEVILSGNDGLPDALRLNTTIGSSSYSFSKRSTAAPNAAAPLFYQPELPEGWRWEDLR